MNNFFIFVPAVLVLVGLILAALAFLIRSINGELEDLIQQAADRDAGAQLDYLEKSECNLFFNPTINSWGLMDGSDKLVAAGHSVRTTLRRARDGDIAQRVADDFQASEARIAGADTPPAAAFPNLDAFKRFGKLQ